MSAVHIITDSTADLSRELLEASGVRVVPLLVELEGQTFADGVELDTEHLFALVEQHRRLPKTASPSPGAFKEAFEAATANGDHALYIGISTQFSATVQNARLAADMLPPGSVTVIDSENLSTGIGLQVLYACDLARQGLGPAEIAAAVQQARPKVRTAFMIDTLDYLHMGGRCSGVQALVGSLLKLRPIIAVTGGAMGVAAKVRGARQKGLDWMLERFAEDARAGLVRPERVFLTHTGVHEDAVYMAEAVRRIMPDVQQVLETRAGAVVASHCGPGTIGILYMVK
ncbi:MAG TPA: DegV family protein [Symbiobacteriaceae bacterium]|nr:DegV family protein [Symbiobacteriaceae bacterium]